MRDPEHRLAAEPSGAISVRVARAADYFFDPPLRVHGATELTIPTLGEGAAFVREYKLARRLSMANS